MNFFTALAAGIFMMGSGIAQTTDSSRLRIKNFSPYFNVHVDSALRYQFIINKNPAAYYWFLKNSPAGLRIGKDDGILALNINKSFFLSGRLKYDMPYVVALSVQNLENDADRVDTSFTIQFYNTEIYPSKLKPSIASKIFIDEGDSISFTIQCDNGSFPIEQINYTSNYSIRSSTNIASCGDAFTWSVPFDFIKETDREKTKSVQFWFIGTTKFQAADTAQIEITVRDNINYPEQLHDFAFVQSEMSKYIVQLKSSFRMVDSKVKRIKSTRTAFDLASASTALGGTVFSSLPGESNKTTGKILPSVGVAMVPVKEATAPNNTYEQNSATLIRSSIRRLEYMLNDTRLTGERDPDIINKTKKLRNELTQTQVQLIDIPIGDPSENAAELDKYFNSPKVNKKYKVKHKK